MKDFPVWLRDALQGRFDEQSALALKHPPIKNIRERLYVAADQFQQKMSEAGKEEYLRLEEEFQYLQGQELEWVYMQGVKDGAQLLFSLLCDSGGEYELPATKATCGDRKARG